VKVFWVEVADSDIHVNIIRQEALIHTGRASISVEQLV
jgi:hypothetical protein